MNTITVIVTCTFGIEAVVKRELQALGFHDFLVSDGKIEFQALLDDIPRLNLWLRSADRVLIKLAEFRAIHFDQLFDGTRAVDWGRWIPRDGKITVIGKSVRSLLKSVRTNQSMVKKAIVECLKEKYRTDWLKESGSEYTIQIAIHNDTAQLTLDTTGEGLHRRGYRTDKGEVPLRENLAAALVLLSGWKGNVPLTDPMCGAGTIVIEAAMIARNIAPGLNRSFAAERWPVIAGKKWTRAREEARQAIKRGDHPPISGSDIHADRVSGARRNAKNAGVEQDVSFERKDIQELVLPSAEGVMVTNPPYGVKLSDSRAVRLIYRRIDQIFKDHAGWKLYLLTADKEFPAAFRRARPDKVRKLYNGTLQVNLYQYFRLPGTNK